jgi:hypothetical protein
VKYEADLLVPVHAQRQVSDMYDAISQEETVYDLGNNISILAYSSYTLRSLYSCFGDRKLALREWLITYLKHRRIKDVSACR